MLYPKKCEKVLSVDLFENPTAEYRATPFWAWNCELDKNELWRQIDVFQKMGFGGFHMHVRSGLATPYLSDEFMALTRACVERAKENEMLAWLYDEDRWPSGFAGGLFTKEVQYRLKQLYFTAAPKKDPASDTPDVLLARYDIELNEKGELASYRLLEEDEKATHDLWYAYLRFTAPHERYNDAAYVDTMSKKAIEKFVTLTHDTFFKHVGDEFGKTIPAIFTDEPQMTLATNALPTASSKNDLFLPYTDDLPESFAAVYGEDLLAHIPELVFELPNGKISTVRYHYYDHIAERFATAFADTCGDWCKKHGIALTGHLMSESRLDSQTSAVGEAMRSYRSFQLPGIDMLCNKHEFTTAKQAESAVHQYGTEGMLSELDGVTGWDFDFRGHKLHGDWQAALGVTVRVPHLSWVSMKGEAKRDYPASISYQSPWYEKYKLIEDHFARVATAMTRGKPLVKIGVIHPIESCWLYRGPASQTEQKRGDLNKNFEDIISWLLFSGLDFDFISESLLPSQCKVGGAPLQVGEMAYDAIVVPELHTMRTTTLERLEAFKNAGGKLIFMGEVPKYENAVPSQSPALLAEKSLRIPFCKSDLVKALEDVRTIMISDTKGMPSDDLLYSMREDNDCRWLFIANGKEPYNRDVATNKETLFTLDGYWRVELYDTMNGKIAPINATYQDGKTVIQRTVYPYDSFLFRLSFANTAPETIIPTAKKISSHAIFVPETVSYMTNEPNALLLDMGEWALDDEPYQPKEEILRADTALRRRIGYRPWNNRSCQPWCLPKTTPTHTARIRFTITSEIEVKNALLASEIPDDATILLDGSPVENSPCGYYVDLAIRTVPLPTITAGTHTLELIMPYGERTSLEWCYLLGDFGVAVAGRVTKIIQKPKELAFGSITAQGFPFYSGKLTYQIPLTVKESGDLRVSVPQYRAATVLGKLDEGEEKQLSFLPNTATFDVTAGVHTLTLDAYINRTNGFGPLHLADEKMPYQGPFAYRTQGDCFTYEYRLKEQGLISAPQIAFLKETQ